jgi:ATP-dependent DNA helicase RecQ
VDAGTNKPMSVYHDILKQYWGHTEFREPQLEIIESVCSGNDTLALMPTGGGKSITFQIPGIVMDGLCLVVSPLIALMKDQVENLRERGIKAAAIYSGMTREEIIVALDNCIYGDYKFLYVSPERLSTDLFLSRLPHLQVNLLAIDESHCISQWGYDFRPSYLNIADIREHLPEVPILALTATATPDVVKDIQSRLRFKQPNVFRKGFERPNLSYVVRPTEDKEKMLLQILKKTPGSAVVYVRSRKRTKEISDILRKTGITADYFHAGLTNEQKDNRQKQWKSGACRVIVATNAFGMGIDKSDVRLVIHLDLPDSLEAYFQEAGRAGRDGKRSYAVLLYQKADSSKLKKRLSDSFPNKETVRDVYVSLAHYFQIPEGGGRDSMLAFDLIDFCSRFHYNSNQGYHALKLLEQAGYLQLTEELDNPSRVCFLSKREDLYYVKLGDPVSDELLQVLLRSYTGLFADYTPIQEEVLAKRLGIQPKDVYDKLLYMARTGIIHFIPRKKSPYIFYTLGREARDRIRLPREIYEDMRDRYQARIDNMLSYSTNDQVCRSRQLLLYFGQKDSKSCGCCDVCLHKNEAGVGNYDFDQIWNYVRNRLSEKPEFLTTLVDESEFVPEKILKVIRYQLNEGSLKPNGDRLILSEGI